MVRDEISFAELFYQPRERPVFRNRRRRRQGRAHRERLALGLFVFHVSAFGHHAPPEEDERGDHRR
ncbi:hypothetical protein SDC9_129986 [bioreactor metagenome]|uniref:Uncharacterized protein n=1 Tax=bioreactor metagenome TaxID=1076179 RepID=A0A645D130_9ZZZZ